MVISVTTQTPQSTAPLIATELRYRLVSQIVKAHGVDPGQAHRIVTGAITFLMACAKNPDMALRPSKAVDIGWHQFILNTRDYAEFCQRVAGRFIHHQPDEFETPGQPAAVLAPTLNAIRVMGFEVDPTVWATGSGDCSQCHGGCTDCGQGPRHQNGDRERPVLV